MPTYEYECEKCGKVFDLFQSMKDEPIKICQDENCGGHVKRLIGTGAGLIFKGSGFYITDYRSEGYKKAAKGDSSSGTASGASGSGSTGGSGSSGSGTSSGSGSSGGTGSSTASSGGGTSGGTAGSSGKA